MEKNYLLLAALLHDIGKFYERSRNEKLNYQNFRYEHAAWTSKFFEDFGGLMPVNLNESLSDEPTDNVKGMASYHHNPSNSFYQILLKKADNFASSERSQEAGVEYISGKTKYKLLLESIFDYISLNNNKNWQDRAKNIYEINPLNLSKDIFPIKKDNERINKGFQKEYEAHFEKFVGELANFKERKDAKRWANILLHLIEKYLWCVPASARKDEKQDISLYDHSRAVAAIASSLYDYHDDIQDFKVNSLGDNEAEKFLLVQGDFSGIQSFIFNVTKENAAKYLKGRSFYLQVLSDVICKYLIDELNLNQVNVLYNGGGNFYIITSSTKEEKLKECQKHITQVLLNAHKGNLYISLGWIPVCLEDFRDFGKKWRLVSSETAKRKARKFTEIDFENVFEARESDFERKVDNPFYQSFRKFSEKITKADYISFQNTTDKKIYDKYNSPFEVFSSFGYNIGFNKNYESENYRLNDTDFRDCDGFKLAVNKIETRDFTEISELAIGSPKLAVLKIDVDNLGLLFSRGLDPKERTISRVATLSRNLKTFFEGHINKIIDGEKYLDENGKRAIYVLYSGGDDTLLIGAYDKVVDLALEIREEFQSYVCRNQDITLSASITIIDNKFPFLQAANISEEALDKAKHKDDKKNKISIFGEIFTWKEFYKIIQIKDILYDLIENEDEKKREPRSILQKIYKSAKGFKNLMEKSTAGFLHIEKIWRFRYYLRNMKDANEDTKNKLVKIYEDILIKNIFDDEKIENIMILPVAARLTELLTKKKKEESLINNK